MKARPTRWPVKVPGPVVTARRSSAAKATPASRHRLLHHRRQRFGMAARHFLKAMGENFFAVQHRDRTGAQRRIDGQDIFTRILHASSKERRGLRGKHARRIAMAQGAEEIGFDGGAGEEFLVHAVAVEARHRAAIQPQRPRRDDEIAALQACRCGTPSICVTSGLPAKVSFSLGLCGNSFGKRFGKIQVIADDRHGGRRHGLFAIAFVQQRLQPRLGFLRW